MRLMVLVVVVMMMVLLLLLKEMLLRGRIVVELFERWLVRRRATGLARVVHDVVAAIIARVSSLLTPPAMREIAVNTLRRQNALPLPGQVYRTRGAAKSFANFPSH